MTARGKRTFLRRCRIYFRRFRITLWLLCLALLGGFLYVNQIGLPEFLKRPLLEELRSRGIDLQFSRLRFRFYQGIVAENVHFGQTDEPTAPHLTAAEVQVGINLQALRHRQLQVDALKVHKGHLAWDLNESNAPPRHLAIENIQAEIRLLPDDQLALDNLTAAFAGAKLKLAGVVTNASAMREWRRPETREAVPASQWRRRLQRTADLLEKISFSSRPELRLDVRGDARDLQSFGVLLFVDAPGAQTPWCTLSAGRFEGHLFPADANGVSRAEVSLSAAGAQTEWATVTNLHLHLQLATLARETNMVLADLSLSATHVATKWASGSNALFTLDWTHALTNAVPLSGRGRFHCEQASTRWGEAGPVDFLADLDPPLPHAEPPAADAALGWWTNLLPYGLSWSARATDLRSPDLLAALITCGGTWRAPWLAVTNLHAAMYEGKLDTRANLNITNRELQLQLTSNFDPHKINPLLPEGARHWLDRFAWGNPPRVKGEVAVILPAWTNSHPDWRAEVLPTLKLKGEFEIDGGLTHRGVEVDAARSTFSYSDMRWHLPRLVLTRSEGSLVAEHRADDRTKEFYWNIHSGFDPEAIRPALEPEQERVFELLQFHLPPELDLEVWGNSHQPQRLGLRGRLAVTNIIWRGLPVARVRAEAAFTNGVLQVYRPFIERNPAELAQADGLTADFDRDLVFLTNAVTSVDPLFIASAIGPHIVKAIDNYHFAVPPQARVSGIIPMHGEERADVVFDLDGGPFAWWKFKLPHIAGRVHWRGLSVNLTNVVADFYQGAAAGWGIFDFPRGKGTYYQFHVDATNALLQHLMADLSTHTNHLEGRLNGNLTVTAAHDDDWQSVFGYGEMNLSDGLIWDFPIFGIFSPVLNSVAPGLGNSRANAAKCLYSITNGIIWSDNLEIRASAMRLQYRGTVDLEGRVNARVEAELLRDVWLVGPLVSTVFWPVTKMFEYRVRGTLEQPKLEPVYFIPKLMFLPLHPFKTLKGLFPGEPGSPGQFSEPPPPK